MFTQSHVPYTTKPGDFTVTVTRLRHLTRKLVAYVSYHLRKRSVPVTNFELESPDSAFRQKKTVQNVRQLKSLG